MRNALEKDDARQGDWRSIVTDRRRWQCETHDSQITSTETGKAIAVNPLHENASRSMCDDRASNSKLMSASDEQKAKHNSQICLTDAGR
jgi:hypothetical protein